MKVVILCGGMGTRIREETEFRPKPMVHIGRFPILWHIMKIYARHGFRDFVLCLGYKGEVIKDYFRNYHWNTCDVTLTLGADPEVEYHSRDDSHDWRVTLADTGLETQTGGRIARVRRFLGEEPFLLTYGDGLTDADISMAVRFHREHGRIATVTAVPPTGRFGELAVDGSSITSFTEKPRHADALISGGFFVLDPRVFEYISGDDCVFERDCLSRLAQDGEVRAFRHYGFWQCMDTFRECEFLNKLWRENNAPWKTWT
jgi:glucose-1-phosphate cytidylyltransferase